MTDKRFTTTGYKIYDTFHDGMHWLVNEVEAEEIVEIMNNLDTKARERGKALSKLQKENEELKHQLQQQEMEYATTCNRLAEENEELKKRNTNQYKQLNQLWQLIKEENWETLIAMKKQLKEDEERLQQEWKCYK